MKLRVQIVKVTEIAKYTDVKFMKYHKPIN